MNKRIVSALVLAGMIASTSAFASKARELVLGQGGAEVLGSYGSFYYESVYNMFYNPAYINDYKNWVAFEKGNLGSGEFGFASSMMNFNMGLYFNRKAATPNVLSTDDASVVDLVFGGDAGVKWGLGLTYGAGKPIAGPASVDHNNFNGRVGVSVAGFDPFVGFTIAAQDKSVGVKTTTYSGMNGGLRYHYGEWSPFAVYGMAKSKVEATAIETKTNGYAIGVGRETKLAEGTRLVYSLYYKNAQQKIADVKQANAATYMALPMQAGVEADALSWLTLRAGVNHYLLASGVTKYTSARIGGTFHVSKVDVDYAFGNGNSAAPSTDKVDSPDVGFDSSTFHQVSLRYSW